MRYCFTMTDCLYKHRVTRLRRFFISLLALICCLSLFCSCGRSDENSINETEQTDENEQENTALSVTVMKLQSDVEEPTMFNIIYGAVSDWVLEYGGECNVYEVPDKDVKSVENALFYAADAKPSVIVCIGGAYYSAIEDTAPAFKNTLFLSVGSGVFETENVTTVAFSQEKAAFIAGYTAVADGYRNLGFLGSIETAAVTNCGCGFLQGVDFAAKTFGVQDEVTVKYIYADSYTSCELSDETANEWFSGETEVIFTYGYGMTHSAIVASELYGGKVIAYETSGQEKTSADIFYIQNDRASAIDRVLTEYFETQSVKRVSSSDSSYICDGCFEFDLNGAGEAFSKESLSEAEDALESGKYVPTVYAEGDTYPTVSVKVDFYS